MSHNEQFQHLKIQLKAIQSATNNFSADYCIGHGGFGYVFKGELLLSKGKTMVALKRLDRAFGQGYCDDHGEKILVYEYASKKSLDSYLASDDLTWLQRLRICVGAARGLAYLHTPTENQLRIVHRDIKSSNILLDNNWNAKIPDFGLSKFAPANNQFTYLVSNPVGTPGYIDPLYHEIGLLTKESDVYSFGVVIFEVLCGMLCYGNNLRPLVGLVREYYEQKKISELIYSNIKDEIKETSLKLFADIAYQCLKTKREERPLMTKIVSTLETAFDIETGVHRSGILNIKVLPPFIPNYYLVFCITGPHPLRYIKTSAYNKLHAENNEELALYVENFRLGRLFVLANPVKSQKTQYYMYEITMELTDLIPGIPEIQIFDLMTKPSLVVLSHLKIEMLYKPTDIKDLTGSVPKASIGTPKDGGLLVVLIKWANLLFIMQQHASVSLHFRGELRETQPMMEINNPTWLEEFTFMLERPPTYENLHLELINHYSWMGLVSRKEPVACFDINLEELVHTKWMDKKGYLEKIGDRYFSYGELCVELQWRTFD